MPIDNKKNTMKGKIRNTIIGLVAISLIAYSLFLIKKNTYDDGLGTKDEEKEELLGRYVIMMGMPNNKQNRDKYRSMTIEQLKQELGFDTNF